MLKLDEKDYDLNSLLGFNFDMLKEVLMKLVRNQNNFEKEIKDIKDANEKKDEKISSLEKQITELNEYIKNNTFQIKEQPIGKKIKENTNEIFYIKKEELKDKMNKEESIKNEDNDDNNDSSSNNKNINNKKQESEPNAIVQDIYKKETIIKDNPIISKNELIDLEENKPNTDRGNNKDNNQMILKIDEDINNKKDNNKSINNIKNYTEDKKEIKEKEETKEKKDKKRKKEKTSYRTSEDIIDLNSAVLQKAQISHDLIKKVFQKITLMSERMDNYEENFNDKYGQCIKDVKKLLSDHKKLNTSKFNSIDKKIKDLYLKDDDANITIDELKQKIEEMKKIVEIHLVNQDVNQDDNDYMSSTFKESLKKKFDLNDNRYLKAYGDNFKIKQNVLKLDGYIDRIDRQITLLKKDNQNIKDNIEVLTKNTEELIDNKNEEFRNEIKEQIDNILKDVNINMDKKVRDFLNILLEGNQDNNDDNANNNNNEKEKEKENKNNQINKNDFKPDNLLIKLLNSKVNELNKKIGRIEDNISEQKDKNGENIKDFDDIKKCIVEIYDKVNEKIGKNDLKELYDFYLDHVNQIKQLNTRINEIAELQDKMNNETLDIMKKIESMTHDISDLQYKENRKYFSISDKKLDLSNYVTEKNLKNNLSPIVEELQNLITEFQYINLTIKDISEQMPFFEKKDHVDRIEGDFNEKINSLNNNVMSKYIEKIEFNKIIKNLEIQIKLLQGNKPKEEAYSWILAKQPLKCFNCASCEATIANSNPPIEYLPWNKIPHGDRQYMIGQGFSRLLQKLNKNYEDKNRNDRNKKLIDNSQENEPGKLIINDINNIITINNKVLNKEEKNFGFNFRRYKLPRVDSFRRKQKSLDIPLTDDEKEKEEDKKEKELQFKSPKILKISKKIMENEINEYDKKIKSPSSGIIKIGNDSSANSTNNKNNKKLSRIQSVSIY